MPRRELLLKEADYTTGFYRSAQPSELNFSFLEKLNLRSVIWVGAEEPSDMLSVDRSRATPNIVD